MLQRLTNALAAVTLVAASFALNAQSIDLGRGELPITVPRRLFERESRPPNCIAPRLYFERRDARRLHGF